MDLVWSAPDWTGPVWVGLGWTGMFWTGTVRGRSLSGDKSIELGPSATAMCLFTLEQKAWLLRAAARQTGGLASPPLHPLPPSLSFHN